VKSEKLKVTGMRSGIWLILWGLGLLLAGCEKEGALEGAGEKIMVNVLLEDGDYKGNETVTRGNRAAAQGETVRVSLGEDVYMEATLEEDAESPMRAAALGENVKVRVIAYQGATVASTTEYTVVGGKLTTSSGLSVNTGTTYTFVAYSYNSTISPTYPGPTITVDPANDLLWGSTPKTIQATDYNVSITMNHLFARVQVKATSVGVPNITGLSSITVSPGNALNLTIQSGAVAANAATATQSVPSWGGNSATATTGYATVNTGTANPIYVNIGSVSIQGYSTFTGVKAKFKKALAVGTSYTLAMNFKQTRWARSNIYWNGSQLTFDTQENGHEDYQGVFFRWGSLIGIAPVAEYDQTILYIPPVSGGSWDNTKRMGSTDSPWASAGTWGAIPLCDNGTMSNSYTSYKGDICTYLRGSTWRMPNIAEFGSISDYEAVSQSSFNPNDVTGRGLMGERGHMYQGVFLPAGGGSLWNAAMSIGDQGWIGGYWSRTGNGTNGAWNFKTDVGDAMTSGSTFTSVAYFVRCIKN
jgi:hypothetical protein